MKKFSIILFIMFIISFVLFTGCIIPEKEIGNDINVGDDEFIICDDCEIDSIIVKYKNTVKLTGANDLGKYGPTTVKSIGNNTTINIIEIDKENDDVKAMLQEISEDPNVEYTEPNYKRYALSTPNDPYYSYQWNMIQLNMADAWDIEMGDSSVKVAVIDTGVAYDLDDLADTNFDLVNDKDYVNNDDDAYDDNAHGTHCTGTIAQSTNNNIGTAGMAPGVTILPLKVLADCGGGYVSDTASAIIWAADNGANIISLSLGSGMSSQTELNAVEYAYNNGVTIFAATGNNGSGTVLYPAGYNDYVIAVGATRYDKQKSYYSQYGPSIDIVAPGGDVTIDQNNDGYADGILQQTIAGFIPNNPDDEDPCIAGGTTDYTPTYYFFQGTSMACPHAAALGALLKSHEPTATPEEIRNAIQNTAEDLGTAGWDQYFGHGLINPVDALNAIANNTEAPVITTFTGPASTSNATIDITLDGTDNVGITGWLLKETSTPPLASDPNWVATKPTTYTLSAEGTITVYAWAKDGDENISTSENITVEYSTAEQWVKYYHDIDSGWYPSDMGDVHQYPNDFDNTWTLTHSGATKIKVHFSKVSTESGYDFIYIYDENDNLIQTISGNGYAELSLGWTDEIPGDTAKIRLVSDSSVRDWGFAVNRYEVVESGIDAQAPVITTFTGTEYTSTATIDIILDGTDNVGITGWLVKETSTTPLDSDPNWVATKPTTYTLSAAGTITVYAWAKDAAGNISGSENIITNYSAQGEWTTYYDDIDSGWYDTVHQYPNNFDNTWTITHPGVDKIRVHFSKVSTESGWDFIYIYDENDNLIQTITGNGYAELSLGWTDEIPGDTVKIRLVSDSSIRDWGFAVNRYKVFVE